MAKDLRSWPGDAEATLDRRSLLLRGGAALGGLALGSGLLEAAASQAAPAAGLATSPITLVLWTWDPLHKKIFTNRAREWNKDPRNPPLTLKVQVVDAATSVTKLTGALTAGTGAPDLAAVGVNDIPILFANGVAGKALVPLNDYIAPIRNQFSTLKWSLYSNKGNVYGAESTMGASLFYYRTDVFKQLGLAGAMNTTDNYLQAARKLKKAGKYLVALDVGEAPTLAIDWQQWFFQHAGNIFDADGNVVLDKGDAAGEVTELFAQLVRDKLAVPLTGANGDAIRAAAYKNNSLVAANGPDWWAQYIIEPAVPEQSGKWGVAPLAVFPGTASRSSWLGGAGITITHAAKNPDAAYAFLHYSYLTYAAQVARWKETGYFPTMKKVWSDPSVTNYKVKFFGDAKLGQALAKSAAGEPNFYTSPVLAKAESIIATELLNPAVSGSRSASDGVKKAAAQIRQAVELAG